MKTEGYSRRWAGIDCRYAGQEGRFPIESSYPQVAWSIFRQMAGERQTPIRWEKRGGKWHFVSPRVRAQLKRRITMMMVEIIRKQCDAVLVADVKDHIMERK